MIAAAGRGGGRPLAVLTLLVGAAVAIVMPASPGAFAAALVAAVLTILVASSAGSAQRVTVELRPGTRARAALRCIDPRPAQSDPDARGHARPRAPGAVQTAV
jgi:hypothetical protein